MTIYSPNFNGSIPGTDSADNDTPADVVGNKTDTVAGDSLVSLVKVADAAIDTVDGLLDVPAVYSIDNVHMRDVVGNKDDRFASGGATDKSVYAILYHLYGHFNEPQKVYPTLANGVTVTGGAGAWTLGAFAEVIPAGTTAKDFDIHFVNVESASATDTYEIALYDGSDVEIARCRFTKSAAQDLQGAVPVQCPPQPAGELIQAKCASSGGGGDTIVISLEYHEY